MLARADGHWSNCNSNFSKTGLKVSNQGQIVISGSDLIAEIYFLALCQCHALHRMDVLKALAVRDFLLSLQPFSKSLKQRFCWSSAHLHRSVHVSILQRKWALEHPSLAHPSAQCADMRRMRTWASISLVKILLWANHWSKDFVDLRTCADLRTCSSFSASVHLHIHQRKCALAHPSAQDLLLLKLRIFQLKILWRAHLWGVHLSAEDPSAE